MNPFLPKQFKALVPPSYREVERGGWRITRRQEVRKRVLAYFRHDIPMPKDNWTLEHEGRVWMSLTPMELESQGYHARMASGHVVVAGLGMGALVYNLLLNKMVHHITVVDLNPHIGGMLESSTDWFRPGPRLTFVVGDARTHVTSTPVDTLLVDIWPVLGDSNAETDTLTIQRNLNAKRVGWWGQELDFVSFNAKRNRPLPPTLEDAKAYQQHLGINGLAMNHELWPMLAYVAAIGFALNSTQAQIKAQRRAQQNEQAIN